MSVPMVLLIIFCIIIEGMSQLCFKQAANTNTIAQTLKKPIVWLGILLWAVEVIAWTNVLEYVPLTTAFPIMSLTYVTTLIASALVFKETVNKRRAVGAILITAGVAMVGLTGV